MTLFIAALVPLIIANRRVYLVGAILGGIGVGLFIDEVGKFITAGNARSLASFYWITGRLISELVASLLACIQFGLFMGLNSYNRRFVIPAALAKATHSQSDAG